MDSHPPYPAESQPRESSIAYGVPTALGRGVAGRWLRRGLVVGAAGCGFALLGSLINPSPSQAHDDERIAAIGVSAGGAGGGSAARNMPKAGAGNVPVVKPALLIGMLESPEYLVLIQHADPTPRYTVCTPAGRILREDLDADDVYREFPMLDLRQFRLDPAADLQSSGPLMLAWPAD